MRIGIPFLRKSMRKGVITLQKVYKIFFTILIFSFSQFTIPENLEMIEHVKSTIPSYAKWGKLAMKETKQKYPNAEIIDYLHRGRQTKEDTIIEQFKLWLRGENREFGVFVNIEFNSRTEEVLHITFLETDR